MLRSLGSSLKICPPKVPPGPLLGEDHILLLLRLPALEPLGPHGIWALLDLRAVVAGLHLFGGLRLISGKA